jgi:hypothetical protein
MKRTRLEKSAKPTGKAPVATFGIASSEPWPGVTSTLSPSAAKVAVVDGQKIGRCRAFEAPVEREGHVGLGGGRQRKCDTDQAGGEKMACHFGNSFVDGLSTYTKRAPRVEVACSRKPRRSRIGPLSAQNSGASRALRLLLRQRAALAMHQIQKDLSEILYKGFRHQAKHRCGAPAGFGG